MKRILLFVVAMVFAGMAMAAVNLNTATKEELEALNGIGPVKAQAIIDYRNAHGPFRTPEDVMKVKGIKQGEFGKIRGDIGVSGATRLPAGKTEAKSEAPAKAQGQAAKATAETPAKPEKLTKAEKAKADKAARAEAKADKKAKASHGATSADKAPSSGDKSASTEKPAKPPRSTKKEKAAAKDEAPAK